MSDIDWLAVQQQLAETERIIEQRASNELEYWPDLLSQRARQLREREQTEQVQTQAYLSCRTHDEILLLDVRELRAVTSFRGCTPLPQAPAGLLGVFNHRGQMVSVLELGTLLNLPAAPPEEGFILFTRTEPQLGLRVEKLLEVLWLEAGEIQPGTESPYLAGMTRAGALILNLINLMNHPLLQTSKGAEL